jgi:hypothetical protein
MTGPDQVQVNQRGLEPCPLCGERPYWFGDGDARHPPGKCRLDGHVIYFDKIGLWNRQTTTAEALEVMQVGADALGTAKAELESFHAEFYGENYDSPELNYALAKMLNFIAAIAKIEGEKK